MATRKSTPSRRTAAVKAPARTTATKRAAAAPTPVATGTPPSSSPTAKAEAAKPKHKLVRDSFTIPKGEYAVLEALKQRAARLARPTKKSEVLRAGISALNAMTDQIFLATLNAVPSLKTGRPKLANSSTDKASRTRS